MPFQIVSSQVVEGGGRIVQFRNTGTTTDNFLYRVANGTATEGSDFTNNAGFSVNVDGSSYNQGYNSSNRNNFQIGAGEIATTYIEPLADQVSEGPETFTISYRGASETESQVVVFINDPPTGSFSVGNVSVRVTTVSLPGYSTVFTVETKPSGA